MNHKILRLLICIGIPLGVGGLSAWITKDSMDTLWEVGTTAAIAAILAFPCSMDDSFHPHGNRLLPDRHPTGATMFCGKIPSAIRNTAGR